MSTEAFSRFSEEQDLLFWNENSKDSNYRPGRCKFSRTPSGKIDFELSDDKQVYTNYIISVALGNYDQLLCVTSQDHNTFLCYDTREDRDHWYHTLLKLLQQEPQEGESCHQDRPTSAPAARGGGTGDSRPNPRRGTNSSPSTLQGIFREVNNTGKRDLKHIPKGNIRQDGEPYINTDFNPHLHKSKETYLIASQLREMQEANSNGEVYEVVDAHEGYDKPPPIPARPPSLISSEPQEYHEDILYDDIPDVETTGYSGDATNHWDMAPKLPARVSSTRSQDAEDDEDYEIPEPHPSKQGTDKTSKKYPVPSLERKAIKPSPTGKPPKSKPLPRTPTSQPPPTVTDEIYDDTEIGLHSNQVKEPHKPDLFGELQTVIGKKKQTARAGPMGTSSTDTRPRAFSNNSGGNMTHEPTRKPPQPPPVGKKKKPLPPLKPAAPTTKSLPVPPQTRPEKGPEELEVSLRCGHGSVVFKNQSSLVVIDSTRLLKELRPGDHILQIGDINVDDASKEFVEECFNRIASNEIRLRVLRQSPY